MKELPRRVAEPEERPAVGRHEEALVVRNFQPRKRRLRAGRSGDREDGTQKSDQGGQVVNHRHRIVSEPMWFQAFD
jgi:hypothetical protein